jgi:hypothetical protein
MAKAFKAGDVVRVRRHTGKTGEFPGGTCTVLEVDTNQDGLPLGYRVKAGDGSQLWVRRDYVTVLGDREWKAGERVKVKFGCQPLTGTVTDSVASWNGSGPGVRVQTKDDEKRDWPGTWFRPDYVTHEHGYFPGESIFFIDPNEPGVWTAGTVICVSADPAVSEQCYDVKADGTNDRVDNVPWYAVKKEDDPNVLVGIGVKGIQYSVTYPETFDADSQAPLYVDLSYNPGHRFRVRIDLRLDRVGDRTNVQTSVSFTTPLIPGDDAADWGCGRGDCKNPLCGVVNFKDALAVVTRTWATGQALIIQRYLNRKREEGTEATPREALEKAREAGRVHTAKETKTIVDAAFAADDDGTALLHKLRDLLTTPDGRVSVAEFVQGG